MHPIERRRVAEAAFIYSLDEGVSPQAFAERIMHDPRARLRSLPGGQRPISRKGIQNLIERKPVKAHTVEAVKRFLCRAKSLPTHLFEIEPLLQEVAKKELALRLRQTHPYSFFRRYVGKYSLFGMRSRFYMAFAIDFDADQRILFCYGKASIPTPSRDGAADIVAYLSGYAIPTATHLWLNFSDHEVAERYILNIRNEDLFHLGIARTSEQNKLIIEQSSKPVRDFFPEHADPAFYHKQTLEETEQFTNGFLIVNRELNSIFEQQYFLLPGTEDSDVLGIAGENYVVRLHELRGIPLLRSSNDEKDENK